MTHCGAGRRAGRLRAAQWLPAVLLLMTASAATAHEQTDFLPDQILKKVGFDQKLNEQVPLDLQFRDETGKSIQLQQYFGSKPVMLVPLYYKCGMLCPEEMNILIDSLKELKFSAGHQFEIVVLSIDPRETPRDAALTKTDWVKRYGRKGTDAGWHLLTGEESAIERLTQAIGFKYVYDTRTRQYAHPDGLLLLTPRGKIARYFYSLNYPPRDLRFGLIEASENRIGSPLDVLWLSCYHYNPLTGRYSVGIMEMVRLGAVVTLLGLIAMVGGMGLRERARRDRTDAGGVAAAGEVPNLPGPAAH